MTVEDETNLLQVEQLFNAMKLSDELSPSFTSVGELLQDEEVFVRSRAITWIKNCADTLFGVNCHDAKDISIQIFDKYLLCCYHDDDSCLEDMDFLAYAAAASLIVAGKLQDCRSPATMTRFTSYEVDRLMEYERNILRTVSCAISPLCTPNSFLHYFMSLCPMISSHEKRAEVIRIAQAIIAHFQEDTISMQFAPSTIALSSLFISLPLHKLDTRTWFASIPTFCIMDPSNPLFECQTYFEMQKLANAAQAAAVAEGCDERSVQLAISTATRHGICGLQAKMLDVKACIAAIEHHPYVARLRDSLRTPPNAGEATMNEETTTSYTLNVDNMNADVLSAQAQFGTAPQPNSETSSHDSPKLDTTPKGVADNTF